MTAKRTVLDVMKRSAQLVFLLFLVAPNVFALQRMRPLRLSVLDFGKFEDGSDLADGLRASLKNDGSILLLDPQVSRAAARGVGYEGSLNLSVAAARDLGAALDSDFYLLGEGQTLRRSSSSTPAYFESYCSIFVVSSRTGQLLSWNRLSFQDAHPEGAARALKLKLASVELRKWCLDIIERADADERAQRAVVIDISGPVLENSGDEKELATEGLQLPRPFQRKHPEYPDSASRADAQATVDVMVDVGADGEVGQVQIARWGGFGLDEATVTTVRQLHFFPAHKDGTPVAMRVLLRYNFRKPQN